MASVVLGTAALGGCTGPSSWTCYDDGFVRTYPSGVGYGYHGHVASDRCSTYAGGAGDLGGLALLYGAAAGVAAGLDLIFNGW